MLEGKFVPRAGQQESDGQKPGAEEDTGSHAKPIPSGEVVKPYGSSVEDGAVGQVRASSGCLASCAYGKRTVMAEPLTVRHLLFFL
jgi:hypothetical protein